MPLRIAVGSILVGLLLSISLKGQHVFVVESHGKPTIVQAAHGNRPVIVEKGKRITVDKGRCGLRTVDSLYPIFVSVKNFQVRTTGLQNLDTGDTFNNCLEIMGDFMCQATLKDVFVVFELDTETGGQSLLVQEIGELRARQTRHVNLLFRTGFDLGQGTYQFHLFSEGYEVLSSMQPVEVREQLLDRFIAKETAGRPDGPPQPFICPAPDYPASLVRKKIPGRAVVKVRIRTTGAVLDPTLVEATDPAFGEAAIEALRVWRFIPAIKNGHPVELTASMPLEFAPDERPPADANAKNLTGEH